MHLISLIYHHIWHLQVISFTLITLLCIELSSNRSPFIFIYWQIFSPTPSLYTQTSILVVSSSDSTAFYGTLFQTYYSIFFCCIIFTSKSNLNASLKITFMGKLLKELIYRMCIHSINLETFLVIVPLSNINIQILNTRKDHTLIWFLFK